MIQSVKRAFQLIEALDAAGDEGATLSSLGNTCGLKAPTAHNLLATLVELGYVRQDASTRRYAMGPRVSSLGTGRALLSRLKLTATGALARLHEVVNETTILAVDVSDRRHSILSRESTQGLRVGASTGVDDHFYDTATGRILLAARDKDDLERLVGKIGLPGKRWPETKDLEGLRACLSSIRSSGYACFDKPESHVRALAVPVLMDSCPFRVALGLFYPTVRRQADQDVSLIALLREAAKEIEQEFERM